MGGRRVEEIWTNRYGLATVNDVQSVAPLKSLWTLGPGETLTDRQSFTPYNLWEENNSATVDNDGNGLERLQTDSGTSNSNAVLESSALGIYRPGTQVQTAGGIWVRSDPTGDQYYETGYGREGGNSFLYHRIHPDDYRIAFSNAVSGESEISQSDGHLEPGAKNRIGHADVYGVDPLDGTGPSGIDLDPSHGYVFGFKIGWYGPSVTVPYLVGVGDLAGEYVQRRWPICIIDPVGEPLISRPNEPYHFAAKNNGTTGNALDIRIGGRHFSYMGEILAGRKDLTHQTAQMSIPMDGSGSGPNDWYVVAVVTRKDGFEETAASVGDISVDTDNSLALHARVLPESSLSGTLAYQNPSDTFDDESYVKVDSKADTPSRITVDTAEDSNALDEDATKLKGVKWGGRFAGGDAGGNRTRVGEAGTFELQLVREFPAVLLARTNDGNSATVSVNYGLPGVD